MSIQQSTELVLFVTHVEAEDSYLKIWGQVDKNSATCVERMILPLAEQFARSQGCAGTQSTGLRINALCCARFQNEGYYRARVLNIRPDGMVILQFIDYGNIEILPPQEVHLLENIPGSESLQSFPPVAFDFTLMHVLPVNNIWENKIIESIKKTLWYNEYNILIHSVVNNHRFIKLWYNNEDFSELLVKKHMAVAATLQEMFRPKCVLQPQTAIYQQSNKRLISSNCTPMASAQSAMSSQLHSEGNDARIYRQNHPSCCATQQKHTVQAPPVQEALVFKSRVLDVGSKHDIYVSFVEDGPHKFSVQVQSTSQILTMLMREINTHPIEPLQEPPLPGSVCLGRYTQDKVLCRAVVMSVMENKCKLYYVDFGHTEILPYTDIFQLPPHYINPKVLSIRFTLSGVKELNVTDEMKEYFKKIVSGKSLVLHVRPPEGPPLVQYGDLYDNGNNIKDILRQAFPAPVMISPMVLPIVYQEPRKLLKGSEEIVHISFVESCKKFFVQLDNGVEPLMSIMACLAEFCKTAPIVNPAQVRIGLPCAALYENQWYRAQILSVNTDHVKVLYVDYGNEETVTVKSLRLIHDDLVRKLHAQAIKCALNGWELLPYNDEISNQFELMILEKRLRMRVIDVHTDGILVELYDFDKMESIKSQFLHLLANEKNLNTLSNCQSIENQLTAKVNNLKNCQRFDTNLQLSLVLRQRDEMKDISMIRDNTSKWQKKSQIDTWQQPQNGNTSYEKSKSKIWKDELNEEKRHDSKPEKSNFCRGDLRNDRFSRDDPTNNRNSRDKWTNKYEHNESNTFNKSSRGAPRGNRSRAAGSINKLNHSGASDKSWSDKDSDTSSRSSTRRGRGNSNRSNYTKRDAVFGKPQSYKWNDKDTDGGNFRSGKTNSDFYHGNNRSKERKGQGHRITHNKLNQSAGTAEQIKKHGQTLHDLQIPPPTASIGTTKSCELVFTNSPTDFFVQISPDYVALDTVMESIALLYEDGGDLMNASDIVNGAYCIAQYEEDLKWYRAVIKSVGASTATVQFIDYGNTETVEFTKIKTIEKEFMKLPMQAVHCKLLGVKDLTPDGQETKIFAEKVNGKTLEIEFVTEENGLYNVLLRETIDGGTATSYINEEFCERVDLLKAKENAINSRKILNDSKQLTQPDYAPFDSKWTTISYKPQTKQDIIITWFTNPNNFYCQILDKENEFRAMMNEIQRIYVGRDPISCTLEAGVPVIAIFSEDGALYRAEIIEVSQPNGYVVQYIDFGNNATVSPQKIFPVEKELLHLPKQAVHCSLINMIPKDGFNWSNVNTEAIDNCFNADKYECTFHDFKDNKYLVSLNNNGNDVANTLVNRNLASFATSAIDAITHESSNVSKVAMYDAQNVDISLLSGQALRVKVSNVESASKFHIQLPSAAECENIINTYMANKDLKVMQRLSTHEMCLGTGCLVHVNKVWRRAVISNHPRPTGFDIKLIDTGAYDEILSDCVLALPGELSVMQNQAIECSLENVSSLPDINAKLKELVEGKEVIVYVKEVDDSRLIVELFDLLGNKINITKDSDEKICPICPLPILSSTHSVTVSYADHSASIWLQRNADSKLDTNLAQELNQYYPASGKAVKPTTGSLCAARGADDYWYRAKVIKCTELGAYVNFIDYGHNEEVGFDALMALEPQFYVPHQLAINVSLPVTLNINTESEQVNILQNYLSNRELTAVFYNIHNKWIVELLHDGEKISDKFRELNSDVQQETSDAGPPQAHNMLVDCTYNVYVSHVDSPSQFWLQCVGEAADLAKKQEELQVEAPTFPKIDGIQEEGTLCVTVYSIDNLWYRAQVLDADEDITTVRFIDYGNTDVIDNKSGNLRKISDSWKEIKEYAVKCRLDIIPIDTEDWNEVICEKFENLVTSAECVKALVIANSVPKRVDLFVNGKSVSEMLVENNHGIIVHTEDDLIDEIVDLELDPHSAFMSHINSPGEFWVQEEKSVGDLEIMTDRFIVADLFPKVEKIEEGLLCVAKFPEDERWYRARVVSHNAEGTQVIYIDYGNSATSTEIRTIPPDLANVPPLSRKCTLAMPDGITEWSKRACEEFIKLGADGATIFLLDVLNEGETSLVKLTFDGKNVADILAEFCDHYSPITEERLPPLGEENAPNVLISRINTPDEFWVQTESSITELEVMADRLRAAPSFLPLNTLEVGTICAAKYLEDEQWYRAKILSHSNGETEVLYIDYGNCAITTDIRILPEDIINIPALSKCCALQKPHTIDIWSTEACRMFEDLASNGATMFQFEILDNNEPCHVKLTLNGQNIVDILLPLCEVIVIDNDKMVLENNEQLPAVNEEIKNVACDKSTNDEYICVSEQNAAKDLEKIDASNVNNKDANISPIKSNEALQNSGSVSEDTSHSEEDMEKQDEKDSQSDVQCENNAQILEKHNLPESATDVAEHNTDDMNATAVLNEVVALNKNIVGEESSSISDVIELTVDEIVQNMERNVDEHEDTNKIINLTEKNVLQDLVASVNADNETEVMDSVVIEDRSTRADTDKINVERKPAEDTDNEHIDNIMKNIEKIELEDVTEQKTIDEQQSTEKENSDKINRNLENEMLNEPCRQQTMPDNSSIEVETKEGIISLESKADVKSNTENSEACDNTDKKNSEIETKKMNSNIEIAKNDLTLDSMKCVSESTSKENSTLSTIDKEIPMDDETLLKNLNETSDPSQSSTDVPKDLE